MKLKDISFPSVAVIVVGTNEQHWLNNCLTSVVANNYKGKVEIIYIDNNSCDGSLEFVSHNFSTVKIIANDENIGFSGANNKGIKLALKLNAKYIFLINPDTRTPKNLISRLVDFMDQNEDFGAVGPLQQVYGTSPDDDDLALNEWSKLALENQGKHIFSPDLLDYQILDEISPLENATFTTNALEHPYVQGAAMFIRSIILKKLEGFDINYHTFYEEIDLCRKIKWLKYRVALLTDLYIQHQGGGSTAISNYKKNLMMRNKYYYLLTDPTWNISQICLLFRRWITNDIKVFCSKDSLSFLSNILQLIKLLPAAIRIRRRNKILTGNHGIKLFKL